MNTRQLRRAIGPYDLKSWVVLYASTKDVKAPDGNCLAFKGVK